MIAFCNLFMGRPLYYVSICKIRDISRLNDTKLINYNIFDCFSVCLLSATL